MSLLTLADIEKSQYQKLLDQLYDPATNSWTGFLEQLVALTGSRSGRMLVMDRQAQTVLSSIKHNIDDHAHRDYVAHYVNACPWRPELIEKAPGRLYSTHLDFSCDQQQFYQTEFFNDWAGPQDIHHGICGTVWQNAHYKVQLLVQRTRRQGYYSRQDTNTINQLVPHLQRAIRLKQHMQNLHQQRLALSSSLAQHSCPFAIVDQQGRVMQISSDAETLLLQQPGIRIRQGHLIMSQPRQQEQWMQQLRRLYDPAATLAQRAGDIITPEHSGTPGRLRCLVSPLPSEQACQLLGRTATRPLALIYFYLPDMGVEIDTELLATLFFLSDAEARVAAGVALGQSPQQLASQHRTSVHTVRSQLKSAFYKTGTTRQNELASLVLSSPAMRRRPPPMVLQHAT